MVQNYKEGISWLRKSADQGYEAAKRIEGDRFEGSRDYGGPDQVT